MEISIPAHEKILEVKTEVKRAFFFHESTKVLVADENVGLRQWPSETLSLLLKLSILKLIRVNKPPWRFCEGDVSSVIFSPYLFWFFVSKFPCIL